MTNLKEQISNIVPSLLSDAHFLIDVQIIKGKKNTRVVVILDGDAGIDIDTCADISLKLSSILDEKNWIEGSYILEVSSPGADKPLQNVRQYKQHIGRKIHILTQDEQQIQGLFQALGENNLQIAPLKPEHKLTKNKAKKPAFDAPITIFFDNIKTIQVLID